MVGSSARMPDLETAVPPRYRNSCAHQFTERGIVATRRTLTLLDQFAWQYGTATGWKHLQKGVPNQDAWHVKTKHERKQAIVAVVADGCSASTHAHVGASLGSQILCHLLMQAVYRGAFATGSLHELRTSCNGVQRQAIGSCNRLVAEIAQPRSRKTKLPESQTRSIVERYMYFTLVAAVITEPFTTVIGFGDGVYAVNGRIVEFNFKTPGAPDTPPYIANHMRGIHCNIPDTPTPTSASRCCTAFLPVSWIA